MQVQTLEQTLFNFLILGKSRFPPKSFITSTRYRILFWWWSLDIFGSQVFFLPSLLLLLPRLDIKWIVIVSRNRQRESVASCHLLFSYNGYERIQNNFCKIRHLGETVLGHTRAEAKSIRLNIDLDQWWHFSPWALYLVDWGENIEIVVYT